MEAHWHGRFSEPRRPCPNRPDPTLARPGDTRPRWPRVPLARKGNVEDLFDDFGLLPSWPDPSAPDLSR